MEQHIPILDRRPEVKDEFMSLLQNIKAYGQTLSGPIVQLIIQGFLEFKALELLNGSFKVSLEWSRKFMKAKLGWSFRAVIIATTKLPPNWEDQGTKIAHRVAYLVKAHNVPTLLVINMDQTRIHLVPTCGEKTWDKKGSKDIHVLRVEDKKQIIIIVSSTINGNSLPL